MHELDAALPVTAILEQGGQGVKDLITAKELLFAGSWDDLAEDVRRRQAGKPYLFRLTIEGGDELVWIHRLRTYEQARGESLAAAIFEENHR